MTTKAIEAAAARVAALDPQTFFQGGGFVLSKLYGAIGAGTLDNKYCLRNARDPEKHRAEEEDNEGGMPQLAARLHTAADASFDFVVRGTTKLSKLYYFIDHVLLSLSKENRRKAFATSIFTEALRKLLAQAPSCADGLQTAFTSLSSVQECCTVLVRRTERAEQVFSLFFSEALKRPVTIRVALINGGQDPVASLIDLVGKVWRQNLDQPDDYVRRNLLPQLQEEGDQDACSSRDPGHPPCVVWIPDGKGYTTPYVDGATAQRARDLVLGQQVPEELAELVTKSVKLFDYFRAGDQRLHALLDSQREDTDVLVREFILGQEGAAQEREVAAAHGHIDIEVTAQAMKRSKRQASQGNQIRLAHRAVVPVRKTLAKSTLNKVFERQLARHVKPLQDKVEQLQLANQQLLARVDASGNVLFERASQHLARERESFLAEISFRFNQKLLDLRDGIIEVVTNPTGVLVNAFRRAVKVPARRTTMNPTRFPENQHATNTDLVMCMSLQLALLRELNKTHRTPVGVVLPPVLLTYGAWKRLRNVFGKRALRLRQEDNEAGRCDRPLLWAFMGSSENSGQRYVYLSDDAERYVKVILQQPSPVPRTVMMGYVRTIIASTPPEDWPGNNVELEPEWHRL